MVDKQERMEPTIKPEPDKPTAEGHLELKLAIHKNALSLCNSVEFRRIEELKKGGYELDILLKGLSKEFNQLQGSRKLINGLKVTGVDDPDIKDKLISLAHFSG